MDHRGRRAGVRNSQAVASKTKRPTEAVARSVEQCYSAEVEKMRHYNHKSINADQAEPIGDFVTVAATIGAIAAGVALFEVALIPGIAIGAAAVLAPKYVPKLRRRLRPLLKSTVRRRIEPALAPPDRPDVEVPLVAPAAFAIKQALAKTITFQIVVTTLDFTAHYVVLGNLATAVSLSGSHLVVRPLYYLVHETAWNYLSPPVMRKAGLGGNRALVKTVTYQTIATTLDFTTHYVVVGNLATAAALSAFGFVVSPFVYFAHEMAWDYYGSPSITVV
jgi:uncharacterized membrane protein